MQYRELATIALQGDALSREQCHIVLRCPEGDILELLQAAFRVREEHFGRRVTIHQLINAKSGLCSEDCTYCSQSAISRADIEKYPLLGEEDLLQGAHAAKDARARRFCIVTSGATPTRQELEQLCRTVERIKHEVDIEICTSLGTLSEDMAQKLKESGVDRYNHNLNASQRFYSQVCTTHTYDDRLQTLRYARQAGLELCCGALFGMGETDNDIIDLTLALREIRPDSIPVNFLIPIEGTPMEGIHYLTPLKCLAILSLVRLLNPDREVRIAGGREYHLRSLQPLALYPANSIFVSGYLTTMGQAPEEAHRMVADMGFHVDQEAVEEVATRL
jgi:biotin synthase